MSFTLSIKDKLIETVSECEFCDTAKLAGIMRFAANFGNGKARLSTENEAVAAYVSELAKKCFGAELDITYSEKSKLYKSVANPNVEEMLCAELSADESAESLMPFSCCRRSFLSGAFLGGGSVSDPKKSYHLEFDTKSEIYAKDVLNSLSEEGITAKLTGRKGRYVVYVKDSDSVAAVLGLIGAGYAALELYNVSVEKEIRNEVNRRVNCENANLNKQSIAASKQLHAIAKIEKKMGLAALSDALREMAEVRREYPDISIQELGEKLEVPIGKSGVNHRLNRLIEIAENL